MSKLSDSNKRLMKLIIQGRDAEGWAPVSSVIWPLVAELPDKLVTAERFEDGRGRARLTPAGEIVMEWL